MGLINSNMENAQQVDGVPENVISRCAWYAVMRHVGRVTQISDLRFHYFVCDACNII